MCKIPFARRYAAITAVALLATAFLACNKPDTQEKQPEPQKTNTEFLTKKWNLVSVDVQAVGMTFDGQPGDYLDIKNDGSYEANFNFQGATAMFNYMDKTGNWSYQPASLTLKGSNKEATFETVHNPDEASLILTFTKGNEKVVITLSENEVKPAPQPPAPPQNPPSKEELTKKWNIIAVNAVGSALPCVPEDFLELKADGAYTVAYKGNPMVGSVIGLEGKWAYEGYTLNLVSGEKNNSFTADKQADGSIILKMVGPVDVSITISDKPAQ